MKRFFIKVVISSWILNALVIAFVMWALFLSHDAKAKDLLVGPYTVTNIDVYDGDTFKGDVKIWPNLTVRVGVRISGINTPEIRGKCEDEKELAKEARDKLITLLVAPVRIWHIYNGKYAGRVIANVSTEKGDIALAMIDSGHARMYLGKGPRKGWCEQEDDMICVDIWGGLIVNEHLARYILPMSEALQLAEK